MFSSTSSVRASVGCLYISRCSSHGFQCMSVQTQRCSIPSCAPLVERPAISLAYDADRTLDAVNSLVLCTQVKVRQEKLPRSYHIPAWAVRYNQTESASAIIMTRKTPDNSPLPRIHPHILPNPDLKKRKILFFSSDST